MPKPPARVARKEESDDFRPNVEYRACKEVPCLTHMPDSLECQETKFQVSVGAAVHFEEIKERDYKDMHREESPLVIPKNAVLIDNTNKTKEETIEEIIKKLELQ